MCAIPADRFASALVSLRLVLDAAVAEGLLDQYPAAAAAECATSRSAAS
jgi:hypothetical protein